MKNVQIKSKDRCADIYLNQQMQSLHYFCSCAHFRTCFPVEESKFLTLLNQINRITACISGIWSSPPVSSLCRHTARRSPWRRRWPGFTFLASSLVLVLDSVCGSHGIFGVIRLQLTFQSKLVTRYNTAPKTGFHIGLKWDFLILGFIYYFQSGSNFPSFCLRRLK